MLGEEIFKTLTKTINWLIKYNIILRSYQDFRKKKLKTVINIQKLKKFSNRSCISIIRIYLTCPQRPTVTITYYLIQQRKGHIMKNTGQEFFLIDLSGSRYI